MTAFFESIGTCPPIFDEARAADALAGLATAFAERDDLVLAAKLLEEPNVRGLLAAALSGAPYLAAIARRDPHLVAEILLRDPDKHLAEAGAELAREIEAAKTAKEAMAALRRFKRKVQQEDIIKDIKKHSFYLKPGDKRRAKQALARKRNRKKMRRETE